MAFPQILYIKPEDEIVLQMMKCIDTKDVLNEHSAIGTQYLLTPNDVASKYTENEVHFTEEISSLCHFDFYAPRGKMIEFNNEFGSLSSFATVKRSGLGS